MVLHNCRGSSFKNFSSNAFPFNVLFPLLGGRLLGCVVTSDSIIANFKEVLKRRRANRCIIISIIATPVGIEKRL